MRALRKQFLHRIRPQPLRLDTRNFGKRIVNRRRDVAQREIIEYAEKVRKEPILTGEPYIEPKYESWVHNLEGDRIGIVPISSEIFDEKIRKDILHRNVVYLNNKERGWSNKKVLTRGEVRGSTKKVYKQKGLGRARRGPRNAPHHVGGGKAHGPRPRSFETKLNKKIRKLGNKIALAARYHENNLIVIDQLKLSEPRTAAISKLMKNWGWNSALFVLEEENDRNFELACRNIPVVETTSCSSFNVKKALLKEKIVLSLASLSELQDHLTRVNRPPPSAVQLEVPEYASEDKASVDKASI
mmetsp:Transcript_23569/g.35295  ORF Transcript_23569/g.35295 Transcript_23569/m.35295 type:complete len:300 (-) Transcript_23569:215-1114(-)